MIELYSEYSSLTIDEINKKIADNLLNPSIDNLILNNIQPGFNSDRNLMVSKYQIMSPYMLSLILNSNYKSFLEFAGGIGLLSELIKEINPTSIVTYGNVNSSTFEFTKWRINKNKLDIRLLELNDFKIIDIYDVIISDGFLQYFEEEIQIKMLQNMIEKTSRNGILCLLVDISGHSESYPLYYDVDIVKLHEILENSDMVCVYGKNTFSSLWKKMI